jgi:hypothetical protein
LVVINVTATVETGSVPVLTIVAGTFLSRSIAIDHNNLSGSVFALKFPFLLLTEVVLAVNYHIPLFLGHFYLGCSLLELDKVDEAIKHLQTAFELGKKDPSSYYDDTIPSKLR